MDKIKDKTDKRDDKDIKRDKSPAGEESFEMDRALINDHAPFGVLLEGIAASKP